MKILLIGGAKINNAARALEQRFNTLETSVATDKEQLELYGNSGLRFDRILIFEQAITLDGEVIDKKQIRTRTQTFIEVLKSSFDSFDLVGIADSNEVMQSLREEMFEIKHRAVVVKVKAAALSANILAGIASKSIADLREIYKEVDVDRSIYRDASSVLWSSEIEKSDDWDMDSDGVRATNNGKARARFNEETMQWEEIGGDKKDSASTPVDNVQLQAKQPVQQVKQPPKKKTGIFGNRKV